MFQDLHSISFSNLSEHNVDAMAQFSPNGSSFAAPVQCQLIVWDLNSKEVLHKFICDYCIDSIVWSPDSELIYCSLLKQNIIQIWSVVNPIWKCKIIERPLAIHDIQWAPDSRHLLVVCEFNIKITVWSLVSSITAVIENPKPIRSCISFSSCERYLAVAVRRKGGDCVDIYTCDTWEMIRSFSVETKDLAEVCFSPSDLVIGILETTTEEPKVLFYSIDGRLLGKHSRSASFGLTGISWNLNRKLIALGDYFGQVTILSSSNYEEITSYHHPDNIESDSIVLYRIMNKTSKVKNEATTDSSSQWEYYEVVKNRPFSLSSPSNSSDKNRIKNVKSGIQNLMFSNDGQYLATVNASFPKVVWIFSTRKLKLVSVVVHHNKIRDVSWHLERNILAICSASGNLDMWTPSSCITLILPFKEEISIRSLAWCPKPECLLLNAKENFSILHLPSFSSEDSLKS